MAHKCNYEEGSGDVSELDGVGSRNKLVVTAMEHLQCITLYQGFCYNMDIPKHGIAFPMASLADAVAVNTTEKQHCGV
eukprot:340899-Ditylum_brightwellii.AAC.1